MSPKVLFTASTDSHIAHFHRPYLRAFADLGWTVDVACGGETFLIPEARRRIVLPFQKSITAPSNLQAQAMLRRELRGEGYDLIITHTSLAAFFTRLAARGLAAAVVNVCHGYLFDENTPTAKRLLLLEAEKLTAGRTDLLLTMNQYDYALAQRHHLGVKIAAIPGIGVDYSAIDACAPAAGPALRTQLGLPQGAFVLLYPAEFSPRKSQETLIRALTLLPDNVFLLLPGQGSMWGSSKTLAARLGVANQVRFPGYVSDMAPWYAASDCAVTSSRSEGLPFNVMEAMRAALPVVASAVKGHTDLIQEGKNGFLFPWGNAQACAERIQALLDAPTLRRSMGETGRAASEAYGLKVVLPQVMAAYQAIVSSSELS